MNELEKQLSDVLHELAPEPPPFRFEPVDELGAARTRRDDRPRRHRTSGRPLLAAAAVVAIGAGVALASLDHGRPDPAPGVAPVPVCRNDDLAVDTGDPVLGRGEVRIRIGIGNATASACRLRRTPWVGVVQDMDSRTPQTTYLFPTPDDGDLVLDSGTQLVLDVRTSSRGTCRRAGQTTAAGLGLSIATQDRTVITSPLGLVGCVLTPTSASVRKQP